MEFTLSGEKHINIKINKMLANLDDEKWDGGKGQQEEGLGNIGKGRPLWDDDFWPKSWGRLGRGWGWGVIQVSVGRAFQAERRASVKALRQESAVPFLKWQGASVRLEQTQHTFPVKDQIVRFSALKAVQSSCQPLSSPTSHCGVKAATHNRPIAGPALKGWAAGREAGCAGPYTSCEALLRAFTVCIIQNSREK